MPELSLFSAYVRTDHVRTYAAIALQCAIKHKRQDTIATMISCLCLFTALRAPSAEPPVNKKRTRTLSHKESGWYNLGRHS